MIVTVAWWRDWDVFLREAPIHCLAASMRAFGSKGPLFLLINDKGSMPGEYLDLLDALGVVTVPIPGMLDILESGLPQLGHLPLFERGCLLRWLLLDAFLENMGENQRDVLVVDSDVIFLVAPEELIKAFSGRTFVLQGCPAFTFLSDPREWISQYKNGLARFIEDIRGFSQMMTQDKDIKVQWATRHLDLYGSWDRNPLASDQDLINALIANGLLRQDPVREVCTRNGIALSENPLNLPQQLLRTSVKEPIQLRLLHDGDGPPVLLANASRVTHLHFQYDFVFYCTAVLAWKALSKQEDHRHIRRIANHVLLQPPPQEAFYHTGDKLSRLELYAATREVQQIVRKGMMEAGVPGALWKKYFPPMEPRLSLKEVFCTETWWDPTVSFFWDDPAV